MKIILSFDSKEIQGKKVAYPHRSKAIIGNWKMNKTIAETRSFVSALALSAYFCKAGLAVPFSMIPAAAEAARGTTFMIGAQNVAAYKDGPITGEISNLMLKDAGASFAIVGHSERRTLFHEDNETINRKTALLIEEGLQPLVCIGETESEHKLNKTEEVLLRQISECLEGLSSLHIAGLILAYEPIWAIGTGQAATPQKVQNVHAYCRKVIADKWGNDAAEKISILYGGSVNPGNASELLALKDVDGLLVGGASLVLETFGKILTTVKSSKDNNI